MKKLFLLFVVLLFFSCGDMEMGLNEKNRQSRYEGLHREIKVIHPVTGEIIFQQTGKTFIDDLSTNGDVTVIFITGTDGKNIYKKIDIIGPAIIIAEEK